MDIVILAVVITLATVITMRIGGALNCDWRWEKIPNYLYRYQESEDRGLRAYAAFGIAWKRTVQIDIIQRRHTGRRPDRRGIQTRHDGDLAGDIVKREIIHKTHQRGGTLKLIPMGASKHHHAQTVALCETGVRAPSNQATSLRSQSPHD